MKYHFSPVRMALIKESTNNKYWRGCGEKRTLVYRWWECKLVQPLWKTVWSFLKKLKIELPCAVLCLVAQLCLTLCDPMDCSQLGSSVHSNAPGKNTGVGCHALLQGIFLTQELNQGLLAMQVDSLAAELLRKP